MRPVVRYQIQLAEESDIKTAAPAIKGLIESWLDSKTRSVTDALDPNNKRVKKTKQSDVLTRSAEIEGKRAWGYTYKEVSETIYFETIIDIVETEKSLWADVVLRTEIVASALAPQRI